MGGDRRTPEPKRICNFAISPKFVCELVHKGGAPNLRGTNRVMLLKLKRRFKGHSFASQSRED
jgi:hypothetical protein